MKFITLIIALCLCVPLQAKYHKPHWKKNPKAVHHKFHGLKHHKHKPEHYHRFLKGPKVPLSLVPWIGI